jgi:hypothetical protein
MMEDRYENIKLDPELIQEPEVENTDYFGSGSQFKNTREKGFVPAGAEEYPREITEGEQQSVVLPAKESLDQMDREAKEIKVTMEGANKELEGYLEVTGQDFRQFMANYGLNKIEDTGDLAHKILDAIKEDKGGDPNELDHEFLERVQSELDMKEPQEDEVDA